MDEPEDYEIEKQKYRQMAEAKNQKAKVSRAPKIQQPFKEFVQQNE